MQFNSSTGLIESLLYINDDWINPYKVNVFMAILFMHFDLFAF